MLERQIFKWKLKHSFRERAGEERERERKRERERERESKKEEMRRGNLFHALHFGHHKIRRVELLCLYYKITKYKVINYVILLLCSIILY